MVEDSLGLLRGVLVRHDGCDLTGTPETSRPKRPGPILKRARLIHPALTIWSKLDNCLHSDVNV